MSRLSPTESSPTPTNASLHPALQMALVSLDVQIDAELERYRTARRKTQPSRFAQSGPVIIEGQLQQPVVTPPQVTSDDTFEDLPADSAAAHEVASDDLDAPSQPPSEPFPDTTTPPQDYLESAERLRQSEIELETQADASESKPRRITPLGVGSILLFLAATATLGYVVFNPESLDRIGLERFLGNETASEGELETEAPEPESDTTAGEPRLPTSPDLAAEEFVELDLNTLSGLDPEIPEPAPSPAASPSPTAPTAAAENDGEAAPTANNAPAAEGENSLDNISALLTPETSGNEEETPAAEPEAAEDNVAETEVDTSDRPEPTINRDANYYGYYFVVVDYNDEAATLDRVRELVPDAYLREFPEGVKVQVGAFDDTASAENLVERLEDSGVSARVYRAPE